MSRTSTIWAPGGEVYIRTEGETLAITVTSTLKFGVSIILSLRSASHRVEQVIPSIRTPADWADAISTIQELVGNMEKQVEDALDEGDAPRLAELLYASLDAGRYVEPDVWTPPGTDEVEVSFELDDGIHVIIVVTATSRVGASLCLTANDYENEENDPGLFRMFKDIRTSQAWTEAVRLIQEQVNALAERVSA